MNLLSKLGSLVVDFLFPKSDKTLELEKLTEQELLKVLPRAERLKDRNILALFDYKHPVVKEIVWEIKYKGNKILAAKLGRILYDELIHELEDLALFDNWKNFVLVPIPISDKRRFERGWNQSEILAEAVKTSDLGKNFKYLPRQLIKTRHTASQTQTASREERLENLRGSMKVLNPVQFKDRCVIVIDDVTTTGSTFAEAKNALNTAGVKKIIFAAIAH